MGSYNLRERWHLRKTGWKFLIKSLENKGDVTLTVGQERVTNPQERLHGTIFCATQHCNVGTMLQPSESMSQQFCNPVLRSKNFLRIVPCNLFFKYLKIIYFLSIICILKGFNSFGVTGTCTCLFQFKNRDLKHRQRDQPLPDTSWNLHNVVFLKVVKHYRLG